jgi:hypothetical protein
MMAETATSAAGAAEGAVAHGRGAPGTAHEAEGPGRTAGAHALAVSDEVAKLIAKVVRVNTYVAPVSADTDFTEGPGSAPFPVAHRLRDNKGAVFSHFVFGRVKVEGSATQELWQVRGMFTSLEEAQEWIDTVARKVDPHVENIIGGMNEWGWVPGTQAVHNRMPTKYSDPTIDEYMRRHTRGLQQNATQLTARRRAAETAQRLNQTGRDSKTRREVARAQRAARAKSMWAPKVLPEPAAGKPAAPAVPSGASAGFIDTNAPIVTETKAKGKEEVGEEDDDNSKPVAPVALAASSTYDV